MNKNVLKRVLKYLKADILTLLLTIILSIIIVSFTIYTPILFGRAIDFIIEENSVNIEKISIILFNALLIIIFTAILQWIQMLLNYKMAFRINKRMRKECFSKIQHLPLSYLDKHQHGELVSIIISDVEMFSDGLLLGFTQAFTGIATIIGTIIIMLILNWLIAIVVIVVTPLSLFVARFITKNTYDMFKKQSLIKAEQTAFIDELIGGIKVVEAYNHEDENLIKFKEINDSLEKCSLRAIFFSSLTNPSTRFVNSIVYALVALFGAIFVINPFISGMVLTVGTLTSLLSYANQYTKPFNEISSVIAELQNSFACVQRVFEVLDEEEIIDVDTSLDEVTGDILVEHVDFSYSKDNPLIEDFNLEVKK